MSAEQLWILGVNAAVLGIPFVLAWAWGRAPERIIASTFVAAMVLDVFYHWALGRRSIYEYVVLSHFAIGLAVFAVLFFVALEANRFYPLWITSLQMLVILSHCTRELSTRVADLAYALLTYGPYIFQGRHPDLRDRDASPARTAEGCVSLLAEFLKPLACPEPRLVAERMVSRFGSLARALAADGDQLDLLEPADRAVLLQVRAAQALFAAGMREEFGRGVACPSDGHFHLYLRTILSGLPQERLHATFVGPGNRYLRDEFIERGTVRSVGLHIRTLVRRALEVEAEGLIVAHNHPSGNCEPSADDIAATRRIATLLEHLDLVLIDHLVVGHDGITSMQIGGFLDA